MVDFAEANLVAFGRPTFFVAPRPCPRPPGGPPSAPPPLPPPPPPHKNPWPPATPSENRETALFWVGTHRGYTDFSPLKENGEGGPPLNREMCLGAAPAKWR